MAANSDAALLFLAFLFASRRSGQGVSTLQWPDEDMRAFVRELGPTGVPLENLLAMFVGESGLNPRASSGSAWGLNQAQGPLLRSVGWTQAPAAFGLLSVQQQLPWIAQMVRSQTRAIGYVPQSPAELYRMNLSPLAAKERRDVIYSRDNPKETAFYDGNKGLDVGGKGFISLADLAIVMQRIQGMALYTRHRAQLQRIRLEPPRPSSEPPTLPEPGLSPISASAALRPTLREGSGMNDLAYLASHVRTVQRALGVKVDGKFGPATRVAVVAHQTRVHLKADGIVGPLTWPTLPTTA